MDLELDLHDVNDIFTIESAKQAQDIHGIKRNMKSKNGVISLLDLSRLPR